MVTNPNPMTVGQQTRSDLAGMVATPVDAVVGGVATGMDAIGNLLAPLTSEELTLVLLMPWCLENKHCQTA